MSNSRGTFDQTTVIRPDEGHPFDFAGIGGRMKISGDHTGGRFAVALLARIPPGVLGAPPHRHQNEDEYSCVLEGTLAVMIDDDVVTAEPGTWIFKPRGQWHTFWNAGQEPCDVLEIVSPAGFESYFDEIAQAHGDMDRLAAVNEKYGIDMDFGRVPALCERHGLTAPSP